MQIIGQHRFLRVFAPQTDEVLLVLDINQFLINAGFDENDAPVGRAGVLRHSIDRGLHIGELSAAVGSHHQFRFAPSRPRR